MKQNSCDIIDSKASKVTFINEKGSLMIITSDAVSKLKDFLRFKRDKLRGDNNEY